MDLSIQFILAILPILLIFIGLVFFKQSGTLMGIVGWILTVIVAVLFFQTSLPVALAASWYGVLSSFGISLMVLVTILQVTMMDVTGAISSITAYIKTVAAERYEQIMILNVGFGTFLVSIGATPVTMLPPIMLALGFSPLAAVALPCMGYDPLTSFSLLAVPITLPGIGLWPGRDYAWDYCCMVPAGYLNMYRAFHALGRRWFCRCKKRIFYSTCLRSDPRALCNSLCAHPPGFGHRPCGCLLWPCYHCRTLPDAEDPGQAA